MPTLAPTPTTRHPRRTRPLARPVTRQRQAVHNAPVAVIIVNRIVLRAAIVPERE